MSWQIYFILLPLNILGVLVTLAPSGLKMEEFLLWVCLAVLAHMSMAPILWFCIKNRSKIPSDKYEILGMVIAGAVRGIVIVLLVEAFDLYQPVPHISRILNSSLTVPFYGIVFYYIFESRNDFERTFRELFSQALVREIELKSATKASTISPLMASARAKVDEAFKPLRDEIEKILSGERHIDKLSDIAIGIRGMLEKSLRPLSHELWFTKELEPPVFNHFQLVKFASFQTQLEGLRIAVLTLPFVFLGTWTKYGISDAVIRNLTTLGTIAVIHQIYLSVTQSGSISIKRANKFALFIYATVPGFVPIILFSNFVTTSNTAGPIFLTDLMFTGLIIANNLVQQSTSAREQVLDLLRDQVERGNIAKYAESLTEVQHQIDFATYLHGEVQSELLATSLSLQKASAEGDLEAATQTLERAATLLRRDHSLHDFFKPISPQEKLQSVADAWSGIAQVDFDLGVSDGAHEATYGYAVQACEEIVANAVRHAGASHIRILFTIHGTLLQVSIADDGKLTPSNSKGMGSSLLDKLTLQWDMKLLDPGHLVTFEMALN